jgi:probable rRNA maturation factor
MIEVEVAGLEQRRHRSLAARLRWVCEQLEVERASVGLRLVSADEMAEVNLRHRGSPDATDVLAFPIDGPELRAGEWPEDGPPPELGDVIICLAAAQEELETLAVHGLLHLLGYDHDTDGGEMLALQDQLVAAAAEGEGQP